MMLMVNDSEIMGTWINGKIQNMIGWATIVTLILMTIAMLVWPVARSFGLLP